MVFNKYNVANDAIALLNLPITESSVTLELKTGYDRFPATNGIIKVTEFDIEENITSQEIMRYSTRSGNILNISARHFEAIPKNDSSESSVSESYEFAENSVVELINSAELYKDMQNEIARLETDKLNKGGLRTALATAWRFFFSNGSNNEETLAFGDAGKYLKSTGVNSAPIWDNPPLDINSQTTETAPTTSWLVPLYNGANNVKVTLANLVKGLATATTSQAGVVEMATDVEAYTGTDESRYLNPKQVFGEVSDSSGGLTITSGQVYYTYTAPHKGAYNVYYTIYHPSSSGGSSAYIKVDGKVQGSTIQANNGGTATANECIFLNKGEILQYYASSSNSVGVGTVEVKG